MVWTQEEEEKYLKSPYKQYSIGIPYMLWIDVEAKDEDEAEELALDATANIDVDAVETSRNPKHPRVNTCDIEMDEATETRVWCEDD